MTPVEDGGVFRDYLDDVPDSLGLVAVQVVTQLAVYLEDKVTGAMDQVRQGCKTVQRPSLLCS